MAKLVALGAPLGHAIGKSAEYIAEQLTGGALMALGISLLAEKLLG
jgi:hypothetical protein